MDEADLIVHNAKVTTLQDNGSEADAFADRGERFVAVGGEAEVMRLRGNRTRLIDAGGRRVIPGLNDSHLHAVRGGLFYNLELRWDGVQSLQRGLEMIRDQAKRTPKGQWVRVIGGWSPYQFKEKRMPTVAELNDAAPDTPVFVLFAYSQVLLNKAGVAALSLMPESKPAEGGRYEFVDGGGAIIGGTAAVYATIARLPTHSDAGDQLNSTQYFFRELNRFGMTSTVDAGASGVAYPDDYQALETLAARRGLPIRISNFLFAQKPGTEVATWKKWTAEEKRDLNRAVSRLNGYVLKGAGEILALSAADYENFMAPRPELNEQAVQELTGQITVAEELTQSAVSVSITAGSIDTHVAKRDEDLRSAKYLDVDTYPTITFVSTGLVEYAGDQWGLVGDLTIKDITRQVELLTQFTGSAIDALGNSKVAFLAHAKVSRRDFGLTHELIKEAGGLLVGRDLALSLAVEAIRTG